jgi:putative ABC transport system permease protein
MFFRFVSQSIRRSPRRKAMTVAAVAMGTAVATAMLGVMLDIGDRVNRELRSLGANLLVTPKARSLPVEIGASVIGPSPARITSRKTRCGRSSPRSGN